ncbi:conserved hypothetical protein [Trichinella spiralis]|uniref:hypothetical protein n=1 Tax=Trichinella spiralis TaxID=6334 RepID=UPI0001EFDA5B|nr:conserved hypothetical protein [Trichinella spiralis]
MEVSCLEDIEMEEYGDEPESFAESLSGPSTRTISWSEHPPHPSRRSAEDLLLDNPRPTGKCKAAVTIEDVFHAQLSSGIRELILCRNIASSYLRLSLNSMIKPPELKGKAHPGAHITVNEQLIPFCGRCFLIVRMKSQSGKYGIKVWVAADVEHRHTYNFHGYAGKIYDHPEKKRQGEL